MVQRCIEHDTLNLIAPLPHAHRVAEHSTSCPRVTPRSALGVTWQLTSVSLNFHLPCPSLGVFAPWDEREIGLTPTLRIWTCHFAPRLRTVAMRNLLL